VFDNIHTVSAQTVKTMVGAMSSSRWVLLGQPSPNTTELENLLSTAAVHLDGWSVLTIAAEFESAGAPVDPATAERVSKMTGGMPRFATNAAALAARFYGGDTNRFCEAVESSASTARTAQEVILETTFKHLSGEARMAAALLSVARFSLSEAECLDFLSVNTAFNAKATFIEEQNQMLACKSCTEAGKDRNGYRESSAASILSQGRSLEPVVDVH
jgi:hypothetical protein